MFGSDTSFNTKLINRNYSCSVFFSLCSNCFLCFLLTWNWKSTSVTIISTLYVSKNQFCIHFNVLCPVTKTLWKKLYTKILPRNLGSSINYVDVFTSPPMWTNVAFWPTPHTGVFIITTPPENRVEFRTVHSTVWTKSIIYIVYISMGL